MLRLSSSKKSHFIIIVQFVTLQIGESLKEILNLDQSTKVEYKDFSGAIKDGSTFRNAKAYVYAAQYAQK